MAEPIMSNCEPLNPEMLVAATRVINGQPSFQEIVEVDARNVRETDYAGDAEAEA